MDKPHPTQNPGSSVFGETRWSLILAVQDPSTDRAFKALEELCSIYWPAIFGYLRRKGLSEPDAQDLAQGFFAHLLRQEALRQYSPQKGIRFRSWLLSCLTRYQIDQWRSQSAARRGGNSQPIALEAEDDQGDPILQISDSSTADASFDRCIALALVQRAFQSLELEQHSDLSRTLYPHLKPLLLEDRPTDAMATFGGVATQFGISVANVTKRRERLRLRFRELLRCLAADLVPSEDCIDDELRHLIKSLA